MKQTRRRWPSRSASGLWRRRRFAQSADKVRIGLIQTLSGPAAALGQQARDGFNLAVKELGGKLGGRDVEVIVVDDELKPDVAVTKVKGLVERDKVDFVVGPIFSNVAAGDPQAGRSTASAFLISANAGPSSFAGKELPPELLRHLLPERPGPRGAGQGRAGPRLQEGLSPRAELPGRQATRWPASSATSRARSWRNPTSR